MKKGKDSALPPEGEVRKLIKFSNYSLCITLPKWVIKKLNWEKGDEIFLSVNEELGEILIKKQKSSYKKTEKTINDSKINSSNKKSRW